MEDPIIKRGGLGEDPIIKRGGLGEDPIIKRGGLGMPFTGKKPPHVCVCPMPYVVVFFSMFNDLG